MILGIDMNMIYIVVVSIIIVSLSDILMFHAFSALRLRVHANLQWRQMAQDSCTDASVATFWPQLKCNCVNVVLLPCNRPMRPLRPSLQWSLCLYIAGACDLHPDLCPPLLCMFAAWHWPPLALATYANMQRCKLARRR